MNLRADGVVSKRMRRLVALAVVLATVTAGLRCSSASGGGSRWMQYRGDPMRSGRQWTGSFPEISTGWRFDLPPGHEMVGASPVVGPDGTVYVLSVGTKGVYPRLFAIGTNGALKWSREFRYSNLFFRAAPAVRADGVIVVVGMSWLPRRDSSGAIIGWDGFNSVYFLDPTGIIVKSFGPFDGIGSASPALSHDAYTTYTSYFSRSYGCHVVLRFERDYSVHPSYAPKGRCGSNAAGLESEWPGPPGAFDPPPAQPSPTAEEASKAYAPLPSLSVDISYDEYMDRLVGTSGNWQTWQMRTGGNREWQSGEHGYTTPAVVNKLSFVGTSDRVAAFTQSGKRYTPSVTQGRPKGALAVMDEWGSSRVYGAVAKQNSDGSGFCGLATWTFSETGGWSAGLLTASNWSSGGSADCPNEPVIVESSKVRAVAYTTTRKERPGMSLLVVRDTATNLIGSVALNGFSEGSPAVVMVHNSAGAWVGRLYVATQRSVYAIGSR